MWKSTIQDLIKEISYKKENKFGTLKNKVTVNWKKWIRYIFVWILWLFLLIWIWFVIWMFSRIMPNVPQLSVEELDSLFSQTTTIEDKNGDELYKLFEQHRKNVDFSAISPNMVNAIIAVEDKSFWDNPWVDLYWIVRAWVVSIKSKIFGWNVQWASTITQQSVKNLLLTNDRSLTRKAKEIVLALQLDNLLHDYYKQKEPWLTYNQIERKKKERIMELYLNYIFMWSNAYWIESASNIYFDKSAIDLTIWQSAILAAIPKSPTSYNPHKDWGINIRLMWDIKVFNAWEKIVLTGDLKDKIVWEIEKIVMNPSLKINIWSFQDIIEKAINFTTSIDNKNYTVSYVRWRKDHSLNRLYDEGYISESELKTAFIETLNQKFSRSNITDIKAPHFIFYIQDYITTHPEFSDLGINQESMLEWWYTIVTSLDLKIQDYAETAIKKHMTQVQQWGWSNRSMVYLDSQNWDILAYVWSADYNNTTIEWENDMVGNAKRQPWSSIKPFIYANLLQKKPVTIDTPIFDIPITLGWLRPNNADWWFMWIMALKNALAYSRNIPAVKAYLEWWQEEVIKPFLQSLWLKSLITSHPYWYSIALWAWEVPLLELATAYTHLSALWRPAEINPILEIRDPAWNVIYKKQVKKLETPIILPEVAYLIWTILSDPTNMPPSWVWTFSASWLKMWIKSWTSNKVLSNWQKVAWDGWLATYTPTRVAIFRAWNADWSPMNARAFWWDLNSPVMKDFYAQLLKNGDIVSENMKDVPNISSVTISKISGKLANANTPEWFAVKTYAYNVPNAADTPMVPYKFDILCWGKVSQYTPDQDVKNGYIIAASSSVWGGSDVSDIINWRKKWNSLSASGDSVSFEKVTYNYTYLFVEAPENECEARIPKIDENIKAKIIMPTQNWSISDNFSISYEISSPRNIEYVKIMIWNDNVKEVKHWSKAINNTTLVQMLQDKYNGEQTLTIIAVDSEWFSNSDSIKVTIADDETPPYVDTNNVVIKKLASWQYKVTLNFKDDSSTVNWWVLKFAENPTRQDKFSQWSATVTVNSLQSIWYVVKDSFDNQTIWIVKLTDYYNESENLQIDEVEETIDSLLDALNNL